MHSRNNHPPKIPLTSPESSPTSEQSENDVPINLSPGSSISSLMSSNESLLNARLSMPSPEPMDATNSPGGSAEGNEESALQRLQNAFLTGRPRSLSPFSLLHEDNIKEMLENPVASNVPAMNSESDDEEMQEPVMDGPSTERPALLEGIQNSIASTIFQCPLCARACDSRHDFNEHIVTHSQQHGCKKCDFISETAEGLRDHMQEEHDVDDVSGTVSDEELKMPKTNAQGKVKIFKCKHCDFRSVTKKDFWDHTTNHIREDKMLRCPKCSFITEYKHHLEYHLRNHMGSKPYQCTKCPYSCVNKSMLNSHLKSHSNIYQYRCAECEYATKYCHSLKLHLRKYNHKPAMVLNPDGSPNPLPIIDVYGTRRGPKMKRPDPFLEGLATTNPPIPRNPHGGNYSNSKPAKSSKKGTSTAAKKEKTAKPRQQYKDPRESSQRQGSPHYVSSIPRQVAIPPLRRMKEYSSGDSDSDVRFQAANIDFRNVMLPQAPISPNSIAMILQNTGLSEQQQRPETSSFSLSGPSLGQIYNAAISQYLVNPVLSASSGSSSSNEDHVAILSRFIQSRLNIAQGLQQQHVTNDPGVSAPEPRNDIPIASDGALDLTHPKNDAIVAKNDEIKRRRRKGKATRYEKRPPSSEDEDEALNDHPTDLSNTTCKYCKISFTDRELYTIHMNFHSGDAEPFRCRCGKSTEDRRDFGLHLLQDPH